MLQLYWFQEKKILLEELSTLKRENETSEVRFSCFKEKYAKYAKDFLVFLWIFFLNMLRKL